MPAFAHRWTASRKAAVVVSVLRGETSFQDAMAATGMSDEELGAWFRRFDRFGEEGLMQTRLQTLRPERGV